MRSTVLRYVRRLLLGFGIATLGYVGSMVAYAEIYQRYESRIFAQKLDVREFENPNTTGSVGDLVGKLEIPRIGISVMVVEGVESRTLLTAAGHVPGTPAPGGEGNTVIAAHRDTFFRNLRNIQPGDRIQMSTLRGTYEYIVDSTEIVGPEDTRVLESRGYPELTLISCYPFYFVGSAPKRFIVHALKSEPSLHLAPQVPA